MSREDIIALDLSKQEDLNVLRDTIRKAFAADPNQNVNLHTVTSKACYSSEINLTQEEGTLEEQIEEYIKFVTNPEEPTYDIMVLGGDLDDEGTDKLIDVTYRTIQEHSPHELDLIKMAKAMGL